MFIEPFADRENTGWIEVICGSMFSGKTEELMRRVKRATIARQDVEIFKPDTDTRYDAQDVVSHNLARVQATAVSNSQNILLLAGDAPVVAIDEAQFFDRELPHVAVQLANQGKRVILAGLDMDFSGAPFGPMPELLAIADYITKLHAICVRCGSIATFSYRKSAGTDKFELGEQDKYEPRCRRCFYEK